MTGFGIPGNLWDADGGWRRDFDHGSSATEVRHDLALLEERLDKMAVVNFALWTLLQDKLGLTEAQLLERVRVVDLLDGKLDGKIRQKEVAKCEKCGRSMSKRHVRCMYCGAENLMYGAFDQVL